MIKRSLTVAALAAGTSALAHVGGLSALWSEEGVQIEGGAEVAVARLGDSFRDLSVGELTPDAVDEVLEEAEPEAAEEPLKPDAALEEVKPEATAEPLAPEKPLERSEVAQTPPSEKPPLAEKTPVDQTDPQQPNAIAPVAALSPTLPSITPTSRVAALAPVVPTPVEPERTTTAPDTPQVLAALPNTDETAPLLSNRPSLRPRSVEEAAAKRKPEPKPRTTAQAKPKKKVKKPAKGNSKTAERRGSAQGQAQAKSNSASPNSKRKAQAAGNAAASNYPGIVMRKIQRRKPRTNVRGTAVVSFAIAPSGALAALSLAQSSGSAKLDKLALSAVRRAAPFPRPPSGARTRFRLPVKGR